MVQRRRLIEMYDVTLLGNTSTSSSRGEKGSEEPGEEKKGARACDLLAESLKIKPVLPRGRVTILSLPCTIEMRRGPALERDRRNGKRSSKATDWDLRMAY